MASKFDNLRKITFDDMADYIEKEHPEDKAWFKAEIYKKKQEDGSYIVTDKYNHTHAQRAFAEKYFPALLATEKKKKIGKVESRLKDW